MKNYKAVIQYDGSGFFGFQVQRAQNCRTVQKELEAAFGKIFGHQVRIIPSGRTDRGVHAKAQVISFKTDTIIPQERLKDILNNALSDDIKIVSIRKTLDNFHACHLAKSKTYRYFIDTSLNPDIFVRNYIWQIRHELDADVMQRAASLLIGRHDFSSFALNASSYKDCIRTVLDISVRRTGAKIAISVIGDGFLHGMVRNIVAVLVQAGKGNLTVQGVKNILSAENRSSFGHSAPACGLYLWKVRY